MKEKTTEQLTFRLTASMLENLKKAAEAEDRSIAYIIKKAIDNYLTK